MAQQIIALLLIAFFIFRLFRQKQADLITISEFYLWLVFWLLSGGAILFIKQIDRLVAYLGFSGSGINVLLYLAVLALFYLVFRLRLSLAKLDRDLSELNRQLTLNQAGSNADQADSEK